MESVESKCQESVVSVLKPESQNNWIENIFSKRECQIYVPSKKDKNRCGCGKLKTKHSNVLKEDDGSNYTLTDIGHVKWNPRLHTTTTPTDAYGTIEFQGGPHPTKAQYVRLSYDSQPEQVLYFLQQQWHLELPKLVISVHGGIANFDLQPKLKRVFKKGLLKAAKTTGSWIVSAGINTGVVRHVGDTLGDTLVQSRSNIITLGIAPWGVVHNRNDLIGTDIVTPYHAIAAPKTNSVVLNRNHSYFLLVDDGSIGKYGCEFVLRKKLEKFLQQQKVTTRSGTKNYSTPVVSLVLEGGTNTIRTVLECITDTPPVPVVVCDGSGRAADLLAFTHKYAQDDGTMPETLRDQLLLTVEKTFQYTREQAEKLFIELMLCVKKKELITVFRMGEESQDIDLAILTALLKAQNASSPNQLSLALAWNRVDIARSQIFVYGQEWPEGALDQAMMEALVNDHVDFVRLLLENGVSMHKWLTISRLEKLYNIMQDPGCTLRYLVKANKKNMPTGYKYTLYDIGVVLEQLMGGAYRASFCRKQFRRLYNSVMKKSPTYPLLAPFTNGTAAAETPSFTLQIFRYPYHELMVWAVLLKRQKMAKFMWQHGEEALAKALVACKLYKSMAHEAAQDDLEIDISEEFTEHAKEFGQLAQDLLEQCYKHDDDISQQLLMYEMEHWSDQTSLSLAVSANHREFLSHTCCQILLTEMWMGALRMRKYTTIKVILGIMFFPSILWCEFKTKEELQLMPQTFEEHMQDMDSDSDSDSDSEDSSVIVKEPSSRVKETQANGSARFNDFSNTFKEKSKKSSLRLGKKIYEFYTAPVTKFWAHTLGYIAFLMFLTYIVLVRMPGFPSWQEWFVIAYIFTFTIEKVRELIVSEPKKIGQKFYVFFTEIWNISDTVAIVLFTVGVILRFIPATVGHGKVVYCVDIVFWYIRLLDIFSASKSLGPYVTMIGKMMKDLVNFVVILLIVLMSFGVVRQSVTFPNEDPSWTMVKNIFHEPYFMLYGEVYAPDIDPQCNDTDPDNKYKCVPGRWVVPTVMTVYLIVANILLLNLLIAVFNNTFHSVNRISHQIWKFQRYILVIEYENKPILPPPFIILCHIYLLVRHIIRCCRRTGHHFDNGLKLFLNTEEVEKLHDFEEEVMDDLYRLKDQKYTSSMDERIRLTNERVENMSLRLDDMNQKENNIRLSLQTIDYRLVKLEELTLLSIENMNKLQQAFVDTQRVPLTAPVSFTQPSTSGSQPLRIKIPTQGSMNDTQLSASQINFNPPHDNVWDNCDLDSMGQGLLQISKLEFPWLKKKKSRNEKRLRPFTDYSKPGTRKTQRYSQSLSWESPGPLQKELESIIYNTSGNYQESASGKPSNTPTNVQKTPPFASTDESNRDMLWKKRIRNKLKSFNTNIPTKSVCENYSPVEEDHVEENGKSSKFHKEHDRPKFKVSDDEEKSDNDSKEIEVPVVGPSYMINPENVQDIQYPSTSCNQNSSISRPNSLVFASPEDNGIPKNYSVRTLAQASPSSSTKSSLLNCDDLPGRFMLPGSLIITPSRSDYTTITDDIDTSCLNYISPHGSPVTPHVNKFLDALNLGENKSLERSDESSSLSPQQNVIQNEAEQLKKAEESEHAQMELMIMKRMRHISLTDADSLGDIAKHVMNEMEMSSDSSSSEPSIQSDNALTMDEFSDDELDGGSSKQKKGLKHVKSEPAFHFNSILKQTNVDERFSTSIVDLQNHQGVLNKDEGEERLFSGKKRVTYFDDQNPKV